MKYQAASRRLRGKRIDGAAQRGDELATRQAALCLPAKPKMAHETATKDISGCYNCLFLSCKTLRLVQHPRK